MAWGQRQGMGLLSLLLTGAFLVIAVAGPGSASAASSDGVRSGLLPRMPAAARSLGVLAASEPLHLTIALKPRNPAALAAYAREVSTPGSKLYHAFLTPSQFAARFGATLHELRAVQESMRAHGLAVGAATANRLAVPVSGTAGSIERAFRILLRRVLLANGRRAVTASATPELDRSIAGEVQAVVGLTSVSPPMPLLARSAVGGRTVRLAPRTLHAASDGPTSCASASATAAAEGAYTTNQIASTYGFTGMYSSGAEGQGQTVAVYELESYDPSDIAAYQACYGTHVTVTPVSVDGGPSGSPGGSGEAALDIEQVAGLAPQSNILVYEGPNSSNNSPGSGPYDTLNAIIYQNRARVVSMSWGQCEEIQGATALDAEQTLFEEAAAQGQSVVSATGDQGSEDCSTTSDLAVDDPGSQQFVTAVGGTSLEAAGPPPQEIVWNHAGASSGPLVGQGGAGGGGISAAWTMPGYQSNAASWLNVIGPHSSGSSCGNSGGYCREVPDVSADADPARGYLIYWNGSGASSGMPQGWQAVGGTSAAAPLWAALLADANSTSTCQGSAIGFANPALYHAASTGYGNYFNDVTVGNNDFTGSHGGLYPAGSGYDMASGLGSPKAAALATSLCEDALRVNNPGTQISTLGQRVSLRITTTALPGAHLHFYASKLPKGLSLASSTGRITGRPKRIGRWATGVAALDQNLSLRAAFFYWRVVGAPTLSGIALSGSNPARQKLTFTLTAGRAAPWLKTISIRLGDGARFARHARVIVTYVHARRHGFSVHQADGRIRVVLHVAAWRIRVTVAVVRVPAHVAADARQNRIPARIPVVMTTDSTGHGAWAERAPRH